MAFDDYRDWVADYLAEEEEEEEGNGCVLSY